MTYIVRFGNLALKVGNRVKTCGKWRYSGNIVGNGRNVEKIFKKGGKL